MQTTTTSSRTVPPPPMFVRIAAMRGIDQGYRAASADERHDYHHALAHYGLLTDLERCALSRRFPRDLVAPPSWLPGQERTRASWDTKARDLVLAMLAFAERVRPARLEFVAKVEASEDAVVMALTASGSTIELGRPAPDGTRHVVYRTEERVEEGDVVLAEPLRLGRPMRLGRNRTSDVLVVARGAELPAVLPSAPVERAHDELRARLRQAVETSENAVGKTRRLLQDKAVALACEIQRKVAPGGGHALRDVAWFASGSGSRYEVMPHDDLDIVRRAPDELACVWMHKADIGPQTIVEGAPLVIFYSGPLGADKVAFVFNIAQSQRLAKAA